MALSERDRKALVSGGVALGAIGLYVLLIEPLARAYADLVADHERLASKVARSVHVNRKAAYFAEQLAEYEQIAGELSPPKPYDEQITTIGEQIIAAAQKSGVQLRGSTPTAPVPWAEDPTLEMALFRIDAQAGWENVFKFIASVCRIPGVLSVEQLDLSGGPKKGGSKGPKARGPARPGGNGKITMRLTVSVLAAAPAKSEILWAR